MTEFLASDFLAMGGHGSFIWPAYAVGLIVLGGFWIASIRGLRAKEREIAALEKNTPHRGHTGNGTSS